MTSSKARPRGCGSRPVPEAGVTFVLSGVVSGVMSGVMSDVTLRAAPLLGCFCGLGWLALAMDVHWQQVFGGPPPSVTAARGLRLLGVSSLAGSLALCLALDHPSMAALVWVMALAGSALAIALLLAWRPRWIGWLVPGVPRRRAADNLS